MGLLVLVAAVAYVVDVVTKVVATATLEGEEPIRLLGGAVYLQLLRNPYAAFGMDIGGTWILTVVAIAVVVGIAWFARKLRSADGRWGSVSCWPVRSAIHRPHLPCPRRVPGARGGLLSVFAPNGEFFPVFRSRGFRDHRGAGLMWC